MHVSLSTKKLHQKKSLKYAESQFFLFFSFLSEMFAAMVQDQNNTRKLSKGNSQGLREAEAYI